MADFRKLFYALAMVALVIGTSIPASAQGAVTCNAFTTPTLVRSQAYADIVGDYIMTCTGGTPTAPGSVVPSVNITVFLTTNITSKLTTSTGPYNEALLLIDEPNSQTNPTRPVLNCGNGANAPDNSVSGPGVCQIIAPTSSTALPGLPNPSATYDGTPGVVGVGGGATSAAPFGVACGGLGAPAANSFGCGRPNVFQGRLGTPQNTGQNSIIVFQGVPFDPPGTQTTRTLRITNVRADAEFLGVSSTFAPQNILMSVAFTGTGFLQINNFSGQNLTVATVLNGLSVSAKSNLGFLQCNDQQPQLIKGTSTSGANIPQPSVTFTEGFATAWKVKNVAFYQLPGGNGTLATGGTTYAGTINYPADLAQNATGSNYNTESGWEWIGTGIAAGNQPTPVPNPPPAVGPIAVASNGLALFDLATGISTAGVATQGTRLALSFTNQPQGLGIFIPTVVPLANSLTGAQTGVMVLTATAADGSGAFTAASGTGLVQVSNNLAVYEVLFSDPNSVEKATVPVVVSFVSNLSANPPIGLPVPGQIEQVAGSFAPFYSTAAARQPSFTLPVPRFIPGNQPLNLIQVVKCACDILFPFVASTAGFDTGIAIANTSLDPGTAFGFGATPQQGTVTFFYFGTGANNAAPPASQTSSNVPAGQVLTYVLSTGAGGVGSGPNGLDNRANGFEGYLIAQAGFQYCHGFAFISPLGGGPLSPGVSEGYVGLILDPAGLVRTAQVAEVLGH